MLISKPLLVVSLFTATAVAQTISVPADQAEGMEIGKGWDGLRVLTVTGEPLANPDVARRTFNDRSGERSSTAGISQQRGQIVEAHMSMIETSEQLRQLTEAEASFSYSAGFNSASGRASFFREIETNTYDLHFVVQVLVTEAEQNIRAPRLSAEATDLYKKTGLDGFHKTYGTGFISGTKSGGEYLGIITIHTASEQQKQRIAASLSGSAATWSASASFQHDVEQVSHEATMEVDEFRVGGRDLPALTTQQGPGAVAELLERARNFPIAVAAAPSVTRYVISSYASMPQYVEMTNNADSKGYPGADDFERLAQWMVEYESVVSDYEYAVSTPGAFFRFDAAPVHTALDQARSTLTFLKDTVSAYRQNEDPLGAIAKAAHVVAPKAFRTQHPLPRRYQGYVPGMLTRFTPDPLGQYHLTNHTRGDGEINGHDVHIRGAIALELGDGNRSLYLNVQKMQVSEHGGDRTTFETSFRVARPVFTAPEGLVITSFSPMVGTLHYDCKSGKHPSTKHGSGLLKSVQIVTDTVKSWDDLYFQNLQLDEIEIHFAHVEDLAASPPR